MSRFFENFYDVWSVTHSWYKKLRLGEEWVLHFSSKELSGIWSPSEDWAPRQYIKGAQAGNGWYFENKRIDTTNKLDPLDPLDKYVTSIARRYIFVVSPFIYRGTRDDIFYGLHIIVQQKKLELFDWLTQRGHREDAEFLKSYCKIYEGETTLSFDSPDYGSAAFKRIQTMCIKEGNNTRKEALDVFLKCRLELYTSLIHIFDLSLPRELQLIVIHFLIGDLS